METLLPLEVITFNNSSYFIIDTKLYACGTNPLGIGQGTFVFQECGVVSSNFQQMAINKNPSYSNELNSGFLLSNNYIQSSGYNYKALLGLGSTDFYRNIFVTGYASPVTQIETDGYASFFVDFYGKRLYATGDIRLPSYGLQNYFTEIKVAGESFNVTKMFILDQHYFIVSNGDLYIGGVNTNSDGGVNTNSDIFNFTFGNIDVTNLITIKKLRSFSNFFIICEDSIYLYTNLTTFTKVEIEGVTQIEECFDDIFFLQNGTLYKTDDLTFTILTPICYNVTQLVGLNSNILFISNGSLFALGNFSNNELGTNKNYSEKFNVSDNVKKVFVNEKSTFIIKTTDNKLYGIGNNTDFQLALPDPIMYTDFTPVDAVNSLITPITVYSTRPPKTSLATKITTKSALTILENNLQNKPFGYIPVTIDKSAFTSVHEMIDTVTAIYAIECPPNSILSLDDLYFDNTTLIILPTKNYSLNLKSEEIVSIVSDGINTFVNNKLLSLGGKRRIGNYNMTFVANGSSAILLEYVPTSPICFPAGTPILTDQGYIPIDQITRQTLHNKSIQLTKTISTDKYLVCFEKDSLEKNVPFQRTIMSKDHMVYYKEFSLKAKDMIPYFDGVYKIKYKGEVLYNVLLDIHGKMKVNNMSCETLDPKHKIAQLYNLSKKGQEDKIIVWKEEKKKKKQMSFKI